MNVDEIDPTKTDDKDTTGGARRGDDDNIRDWAPLDSPTQTFDQRRKWWERGGAKPKDPYAYQKLPMSELRITHSKGRAKDQGNLFH